MDVTTLKDLCTDHEKAAIIKLFSHNSNMYLDKEFILLTIEDLMLLNSRHVFPRVKYVEELLRELIMRFVIYNKNKKP